MPPETGAIILHQPRGKEKTKTPSPGSNESFIGGRNQSIEVGQTDRRIKTHFAKETTKSRLTGVNPHAPWGRAGGAKAKPHYRGFVAVYGPLWASITRNRRRKNAIP
jgi:hypothetical protein